MGLSQRKVKQRIGPDPRNLSWGDGALTVLDVDSIHHAADAARFGQAYLEKLGWASGSGLGASGDGRTTHITVKQKLNLLGIGGDAAGMNGDPTIAWKQNKEFERVLEKLNSGSSTPVPSGFAPATLDDDTAATAKQERKKRKKDADDGERKSKRSRSNSADEGESKEERRRRKEDKKRRKAEEAAAVSAAPLSSQTSSRIDTPAPVPASGSSTPVPRHRHHRAKFLKMKRMANGDAAAMAQILGIAPSTTASPAVQAEEPILEPRPSQVSGIDDALIKTSTKSVADYFKEKMEAKLRSAGPPPTPESAALSAPVEVAPEDVDEKEEKRRRKQEKKERKEKKRKERGLDE